MATEPLETTVAKHGVLLAQHGQALKEIKGELQTMHKTSGDISEMFGKIMAATTHTADRVVALDTTMRDHTLQVDRRFTELRLEQDRMCALKHGAIEQRLGSIEQGKGDLAKKVEDMGEITKITYIKKLEADLETQRKSVEIAKTQKFEWKKVWFTGLVAIIVAAITGVTTWVAAKKPAEHEHHEQPVGSR